MNRRRFLKYAGATAAIVGGSAVGLDYLLTPRKPISGPTSSTPTLSATENLPPLKLEYRPSANSSLEELVIMRDESFDPWARVSGGTEPTFAKWYLDWEDEPFSTDIDPEPVTLVPGTYHPRLIVSDSAGQTVQASLPRIVKTGDLYYPEWRYGVSECFLPFDLPKMRYASMAEVRRAIGMIAETGIQAVRLEFQWSLVQPSEGCCTFDAYDQIVGEMRKYGIAILPYIFLSPRWASSDPESLQYWVCPPKDPRDYGEFVGKVVDRYKDHIHAWQIWNEPNFDWYFKGPDPIKYVEMLKEAYLAVKYADPKSIVVTAGLANDTSKWLPGVPNIEPEGFLQSMYDQGAGRYFDVLARQPYADPISEGPQGLVSKIRRIRDVMVRNSDEAKDVWITEIGWATRRTPSYSFSEKEQAAWLRESFDAMLRLDYVKKVVWFSFRDLGEDPTNPDHNYGLVRRDWTPKESLKAYRDYIKTH